MRTLKNFVLAAAFCALAGGSASAASLSLDFDFSTLSANPGDLVTAHGTLTNVDSSIVDLNGCSLTLPTGFSGDDCGAFFASAPLFLNPGESVGVDLFAYSPDLPFSGSLGPQTGGAFTILGTVEVSGYDSSTLNDLLDIAVPLTVTPEPSTFLLFGLGVSVLYRLRRRA